MTLSVSCSTNYARLPRNLVDVTVKSALIPGTASSKVSKNNQGAMLFLPTRRLSLLTAMPFIKTDEGIDLIDHGLDGKNIVTRHQVYDEPDKIDDNP